MTRRVRTSASHRRLGIWYLNCRVRITLEHSPYVLRTYIFFPSFCFLKKNAAVFRKMKIACNIDSFSPAFFFLRFFFGGIETPRYFTQFVANRPFSAILFFAPHPRSVWPWDAFCPKSRFFSPEKRGGNRHFFLPFSFLFLGNSGDREEKEEEEEMHLSALRIPKGEDTRYIQKYFLQPSLAQEQSHLFSSWSLFSLIMWALFLPLSTDVTNFSLFPPTGLGDVKFSGRLKIYWSTNLPYCSQLID